MGDLEHNSAVSTSKRLLAVGIFIVTLSMTIDFIALTKNCQYIWILSLVIEWHGPCYALVFVDKNLEARIKGNTKMFFVQKCICKSSVKKVIYLTF